MVAKEFPKAEHRHCARHIFANWHKSYKGDEMKLLFWSCAKAYNKADFEGALNEMRSNMAETFNAYIIEARSKHLIYMLEDIRSSMMERLAPRKPRWERKSLQRCPRVQDKLEEEKELAAAYKVLPSSTTLFQVKHGIDEVKVDLVKRTCTCKKWDLTGIPCSHAVAAIFDRHGQAEDYVYDMYKKEAYMNAYNGSIAPCPGQRH
ncbi:uncharacterized protein LOC141608324 [Silene latifolia]|uniref:uncharacterized protein LOC141608324 n=1 Tax=Silene latifolia TaxID=37657 RepID=UPI003D7872FB